MANTSTEKVRGMIGIMRDIAAQRKNNAGDLWSLSWCEDAADMLEAMLSEREVADDQAQKLEGIVVANARWFEADPTST